MRRIYHVRTRVLFRKKMSVSVCLTCVRTEPCEICWCEDGACCCWRVWCMPLGAVLVTLCTPTTACEHEAPLTWGSCTLTPSIDCCTYIWNEWKKLNYHTKPGYFIYFFRCVPSNIRIQRCKSPASALLNTSTSFLPPKLLAFDWITSPRFIKVQTDFSFPKRMCAHAAVMREALFT